MPSESGEKVKSKQRLTLESRRAYGAHGGEQQLRAGEVACKICGHPEYTHGAAVPPAFPWDPAGRCLGIFTNGRVLAQHRDGLKIYRMLPKVDGYNPACCCACTEFIPAKREEPS